MLVDDADIFKKDHRFRLIELMSLIFVKERSLMLADATDDADIFKEGSQMLADRTDDADIS